MNEAGLSKTLPKAAEAAAGWPSVRAFLVNHPNLVREDPALLGELGVRLDAVNVVQFPVALARQIDANRRESSARQELEATARANFDAQAQCHAGVVDLLDARSNSELAQRLDQTARLRFGLVTGSVAVEGRAPAGWVRLDDSMVDMILGDDRVTRLGETGFGSLLFPDAAEAVQSVAMIRLTVWGRPGLLTFGAADAQAFTPDMGCELISFLARVLERTAERWPVL
jgi:uncharacterized protein YigA (DUF484 family)